MYVSADLTKELIGSTYQKRHDPVVHNFILYLSHSTRNVMPTCVRLPLGNFPDIYACSVSNACLSIWRRWWYLLREICKLGIQARNAGCPKYIPFAEAMLPTRPKTGQIYSQGEPI